MGFLDRLFGYRPQSTVDPPEAPAPHEFNCPSCGKLLSVTTEQVVACDTVECPGCRVGIELHPVSPKPIRARKPRKRAAKRTITITISRPDGEGPPSWLSIRGESFRNSDGSERQELIAGCEIGDPVELVREPGNRHDGNAVAVLAGAGQIGYLSRADAAILAPLLDDGLDGDIRIARIHGGTTDKPSLGVIVEAEWDT